MKYRMNQKVIVPENWKEKERVIKGWIVGIEKMQDKSYLGTFGIKEYKTRFTRARYKVIYESYNTVFEQWYYEQELDKTN